MRIAALVGLVMMLFFVGGGVAIWLMFTRKLPQADYRLNTRKSLLFVAVCGILLLVVYVWVRVFNSILGVY